MADEELDDENDRMILEELEVLQSIYIDELSVTFNSRGHPSMMSLQLHPATGDDKDKKYVCMTLILEIPDEYPEKIPEIVIKNPRGIGEEEIQSLHIDMVQLAKDRSGGHMLYEIIELAKESLTEGNIPHCPCTICYEHFHEGENFTKTDCYHYFHQSCLSRYIEHTKATLAEEREDLPLHQKELKNEDEKIPCPVCRENITYDPEVFIHSKHEEDCHKDITISDDIRKWQLEMADLLERQKQKGGIIDVEAEKNKFLVAPDDVVVIQRSNSPSNLFDEKSENNTKVKEREGKSDKRMNDKERYRHYKEKFFGGRGRGQRNRNEEVSKVYREETSPRSGKYRDYDRRNDHKNRDKKREFERNENKREHLVKKDKPQEEKEVSNKKEKSKEEIILEDSQKKERMDGDRQKKLEGECCTDSVSHEKHISEDGKSDFKTDDQKSKNSSEGLSEENGCSYNKPKTDKKESLPNCVEHEKTRSNDNKRVRSCDSPDYSKGTMHGYESRKPLGRGRGYSRGRYSSKSYRERGSGEAESQNEFSNMNYEDGSYHSASAKFYSNKEDRGEWREKDRYSQGRFSRAYHSEEFDGPQKNGNQNAQNRAKNQGHINRYDKMNSHTKNSDFNNRGKRNKNENKRDANSTNYSPRRPNQEVLTDERKEKSVLKDENGSTEGKENLKLKHQSKTMTTGDGNDEEEDDNQNVKLPKGRGRGKGKSTHKSVECSENDFRQGTTTGNKLQDGEVIEKGEIEHKSVSKDLEKSLMKNVADNCVTDLSSEINSQNKEKSVPPGFPVKRPPPGFTKISFDDRTSRVKPPPGFENIEENS